MNLKSRLVDDWHWVINHAWSVRLMMLAFVLSAAEVIMPLFTDDRHPVLYAVLIGLVTGAATIARLVAQNHEDHK